jgi:hypothetical protein
MDAVVEAARWWKTRRRDENIFKFGQQQAHQVNNHHGVRDR